MTIDRRTLLARSAAFTGALALSKQNAIAKALDETGLKDLYQDDFYLGTAIGHSRLINPPTGFNALVAREFNALTLENDMKWERVHPDSEQWVWDYTDQFVELGEQHKMFMVGHVLVWHSQTPAWVFRDDNGKPAPRELLLARMKNHIDTLAGRYRDRVHAWDVVNEAVDEDEGWRQSPWLKQIGPDFVEHAFYYAREAAPNAHLMYNDYNMHNPGKRQFVADMVKRFKQTGVPIDGVGMQGHVGLGYPDITEFEKSIEAFAAAGVAVHITELDVDVLPTAWEHIGAEISNNFAYSDELNPYPNGLPAKVEAQLAQRYAEWFTLFLKHRDSIARVTLWGTGDSESWKNNFPVRGRSNYPLLFDRNYQRKPAYHSLAALRK